LLALGCAGLAPPPSLGGTAWQLVSFRGGDGVVLKPDDGSKYTLAFSADGILAARIDCNRARAAWNSPSPGRLELGPMAATRAECGPGSLHDQMMRQLPSVRSYLIRDRRLHLLLVADGGDYEFISSP
jgi:para-nitrobenzyl esterase